jgi:cell division protein FtsI (penicillin-binding protein 3)
LFGVVGGRLIQIQTSEGSQYAAMAADSRRVNVELFAPRGSILDRDGNPFAHDVRGAIVAADPGLIDEAIKQARPLAQKNQTTAVSTGEIALALSPLIGMPAVAIKAKLDRTRRKDNTVVHYVLLKRGLSQDVGDAVTRLRNQNIPGLIVQDDQRREVPGGDLAANVIGYTGTDGEGLAGLEARYDKELRGTDGKRVYDVGAGGQEIPDGFSKITKAHAGTDLALTLDRDLQYQAQKLLTDRVKAVKAWSGSAIVMDAHTGEVLALASTPTYNAAVPSTAVGGRTVDLATAAVVEPGSVHKAITIAAGLDQGVLKPDTVLTLPETISKGGVTFKDTHKHSSSRYTLMGVLAQSSNIGTIMTADRLGAQRLYAYQRAFGLGSRTGIGVPGEAAGIVQPPSRWSGPSYGSIPIGLGVAVTPLQMTCAYATLANGGMRVRPLLVRGTVGPDGTLKPTPRPAPTRVVSALAASTVLRDMTAIATDEGTAPLAKVPGYVVAGKTGTGQRAQGNKYAPGNVTSFIGALPAEAPRYVISVFVHTPAGVGGAIAGPTFSALASFTLRHYGVPPSGAVPPPITLYG